MKGAEALARTMVHLLYHSDLREHLGKVGLKKMEREFDERLVIEKTLQVYQQRELCWRLANSRQVQKVNVWSAWKGRSSRCLPVRLAQSV
jgi:hypothetical protein